MTETVELTCSKTCQSGESGVYHIDAPSGTQYDVRLPSLAQWALYGRIPDSGLADLAIKAEYEGFDTGKATRAELEQWAELQSVAVAGMCDPELEFPFVHGYELSETRDDGAKVWRPISPSMPKEDRDYLWQVALRNIPVGATAKSLMEAFAPFRDQPVLGDVPANGKGKGQGPRKPARNRG